MKRKMESVNNELRHAAEYGYKVRLKVLLRDSACDPMSKSQTGETALMRAAARGHVDCVEILLPVSDPLAQESDGMTALMHAALEGHAACIQRLLPVSDALMKARGGGTALMRAAFQGSLSCVQLLAPVSNIRDRDGDGLTALMWAAACGNSDCVQWLLPLSDVWAQDGKGLTAGDHARDWNYKDTAVLIDAYTLAMSEVLALSPATGSAATRKSTPLRV